MESLEEIKKLEDEIMEKNARLTKMRASLPAEKVNNYSFETLSGKVTLLDLFAGKEVLFMIHNMGQGCRYCTLWADGLNAWVPHLEDRFGLALVSKDPPELQRRFANSRGWRFTLASHGGGAYAKDMTPRSGEANCPGLVVYTRVGDQISRKAAATFGPGDEYCSFWSMLKLAGLDEDQVFPQFRYWKPPEKLDDGAQNVL